MVKQLLETLNSGEIPEQLGIISFNAVDRFNLIISVIIIKYFQIWTMKTYGTFLRYWKMQKKKR